VAKKKKLVYEFSLQSKAAQLNWVTSRARMIRLGYRPKLKPTLHSADPLLFLIEMAINL